MNGKRPRYEPAACPKCGHIEQVTAGMTLAACWRCAMSGAVRVGLGEARESELYDWPATIQALKEAMGVSKERQVAFKLGLQKTNLAAIKRGIRPMPKEALKLIRKTWPDALKIMHDAGEAQNNETANKGLKFAKKAAPARVVATPLLFDNKIFNKNKTLARPETEVTDLFKEGLFQ